MKTTVSTLLAILFLNIASAFAGANYPEIGPALRDTINIAKTKAYVGSEGDELWDNEYCVIAIPGVSSGGYVFRLNFWDTSGAAGTFKEPVLTAFGDWDYCNATLDRTTKVYPDGTKEFSGKALFQNQVIFLTSWSWKNQAGEEKWSAFVTWGPGASYYEVGAAADRMHLGILAGEAPKIGVTIDKMSLASGKPVLDVVGDMYAEFIVQASSDLKSWRNVNATVTPSETLFYENNMLSRTTKVALTDTVASFGNRQFFRLIKK